MILRHSNKEVFLNPIHAEMLSTDNKSVHASYASNKSVEELLKEYEDEFLTLNHAEQVGALAEQISPFEKLGSINDIFIDNQQGTELK